MKVPFKNSQYAGLELSQCPPHYLSWLMEKLDINDPKFGVKNAEIVAECQRLINAQPKKAAPAPGALRPRLEAAPVPFIPVKPAVGEPYRELHDFLDRIETECAEMRGFLEAKETQSNHRPV